MKSLVINIVFFMVTMIITVSAKETAGAIVQSFQLKADTTATNPFTVGLAFAKGDVTDTPTLDLTDYQIKVMKRWNDNSVKHAIAAGSVAMVAGTARTINVFNEGIQPTGTVLTEADIVTAAPSASVTLSGKGKVSLSSLLGSPKRTWLSGISMVEAHYQADVVNDLSVWFQVRLYATGDIWIRAIVENGDITGANDESYTATIMIDGKTALNSAVTHYAYTRYCAEGWVGSSGPDITIDIDTAYLMKTGLVPNYWKKSPSDEALNALDQSYSVMDNGGWSVSMGDGGYQRQIGLLPLWDALYITSNGDSRAFNSVVANSKHLNSYPIVWSDPNTNQPIKLTDYSTYTVDGPGGGGATQIGTGDYTWDIAHHGSGGYLAYLITGDYYHLETMQYQAALCYLFTSSNRGSGTSRILLPVQTRGVAWSNRTVGQLAAIAPDDNISNELRSLLNTSVNYWNLQRIQPDMNNIGYLYSYEVGSGAYGVGYTAPWQQHFWVQTWGMLSDCEPLSDMTNFNLVRDFLYKSVVGILGANGASNYCFTKAGSYTIKISDAADGATNWYDTWGEVYSATFNSENNSCENTLEGSSGSDPAVGSTGFWGNLLPAIAYAVEDGAEGASDSWARLTGANNWNTLEKSGFDDIPNWGIVPRFIFIGGDPPLMPQNLKIGK